jgi:hypothetical protein
VDDALVDPNAMYSVVVGQLVSADARYRALNPADVSVTSVDNDAPQPAILVTALSGQTTEAGGTFTFGVSLSVAPTTFNGIATVTVPVVSSNTAEGTVSTALLTFTATDFGTPQIVTVTGVPDGVADGNAFFRVLLGPTGGNNSNYGNRSGPDVIVLNADADAGFVVAPTAVATTEAGGTATFTVRLTTQPTADATVSVASNDPTEGTVAPSSLVFTAANWQTPQTVTVTGVDDTTDDGGIGYTIVTAATSADPAYNGITVADVAVTNADNDDAPTRRRRRPHPAPRRGRERSRSSSPG